MTEPIEPIQRISRVLAVQGVREDTKRRLWNRLSDGKLEGLKFQPDVPLPEVHADFYCESIKFAIELVGERATDAGTEVYRTTIQIETGIVVFRVWTDEVEENIAGVLAAIVKITKTVSRHPPLSRWKTLSLDPDEWAWLPVEEQ